MSGPGEAARSHSSGGADWPAPPRWGWPDVLALLAWTVAVIVVFGDAALLRGALFYFDITEINFPYRQFLAEEYRAGRFTRWMPGLYCGLPLFSESQAGYLHPFKLLYLILPTWRAFNLDTVLSVWLSGAGTFGWLRRHVGTTGALVGASVFGLNGFVWSHVIHTSMINALASVPLAFWALEHCWRSGRPRGLGWGAVAIACQVFAGHLQDTILTGLALGLYGAWRASQERGRSRRGFALGAAIGLVVLGGALAAVQIIPSKELIDRSPRANGLSWDDLTYGSWSPELLPTLLVREAYGTRARDTDWMDGFYPYQEMNIYMGLFALGLAVLGTASYREKWVGFWVLLAGLGGLLMLGRFTVLFDLMPYVPIIGSGRIPVRYHLWVALAVSALAAVGTDRIVRLGQPERLRGMVAFWVVMAVLCAPILAWVYAPVWTDAARWATATHQARYNWLGRELALAGARTIGLALLGTWVASAALRSGSVARRSRLAGLVPLVVMADLIGAHWVEVPTVPPRYWTEPPATARALLNDPTTIRIFGLGRYSAGEPGYASKPVDFFSARDTLAWSLAPVWGLRSSGRITPIVPTRMVRYDEAANAAGVRFDVESVSHVLSGEPIKGMRLAPPHKIGAAQVARNPSVLPRARFLGQPHYVLDERAAERALVRLGASARERIIVEDESAPMSALDEAIGSARIDHDEAERVEVAVSAETPGYLFLADSFDPGWSATLDGEPVPIRPANIAFRAVFVPSGAHRVVFRYEPAGFRAGLAVSALALVVTIGCLVWPRRVVEVDTEHGASSWPEWWPWAGLAIAALVVAVSLVSIGEGGKIGLQSRWETAFHRFTWGAKVEAIQPPKREVD